MSEPAPQVKRELQALLEQDQSRVGQVYRLTNKGLNPPQIASELGVRTSGFVSNARTAARALLEGHAPSGPSAAHQVLSFVQRVRSAHSLSSDTQAYLDELIERLSAVVGSEGGSSTARGGLPARRERASNRSLRDAVMEEVRERVKALVHLITEATDVDPVDYWAATTSSSPLDVVVRLVRSPGEQGTFRELVEARRIDLTLEAAVIGWAKDLPLQRDLVEDAAAKRSWWSPSPERGADD